MSLRVLGQVLIAALVFLSPSAALSRDNVLLVSIDTLRPDHLSCYGSEKTRTPNIDRLSVRGVRFETAVAPAPMTLPSHSSLLTGLTPPTHGVRDNSGFRLDTEASTLAEVFHEAGYATAAFVGALPLDSQFGLAQGFDHYDDALPRAQIVVADTTMPERRASEVIDAALAWLRSRGEDERWFVWVHLFDPHFPYEPPAPFEGSTLHEGYAGEVMYVDQQLGRLFDFVEGPSDKSDTMVILTADHGESLGEHGERSHGVFGYNSTLQVPLIFSPLEPRVVSERVRIVDVAPTILELQGLSFGKPIEGRSLGSLIRGDEEARVAPSDSYFEALSMYLNMQWAPLRGFYSDGFKYIDVPVPELYDLKADSAESDNLCRDEERCDRWAARFLEFAGTFEPVRVQASVDAELQAQLEALGYVAGGEVATANSFGPKDDPKSLIELWNRINTAIAWHREGRHGEALQALARAASERPTMPAAYRWMAAIHDELDALDRAIAVLEKAVGAGAGSVLVRRDLGQLLLRVGRVEEAVSQLRSAEEMGTDRLDVLEALGSAYVAAGELALAVEAYRRAIAIDDSSAQLYLQLGTAHLSRERWMEAVEALDHAIRLAPSMARAYTGRGLALASAGQTEAAISSWQRSLELDRGELTAMLRLALAYLDRQQPELAIPLLQEFLDRAPADRYGRELQAVRSMLDQLR